MTLKVAVCIGSRPRSDHEQRVADWVFFRWTCLGWRVIMADSEPGPYNRAAARNRAAQHADDVDVLVFSNADTVWLHETEIREAVELAAAGAWVLCESYVETSRAWTESALSLEPCGELSDPAAPGYDRLLVGSSPAGWQVVPRAWFDDIGGWDEGFGSGWGWEDAAFRDALDVLHAPHVRRGWAVHLWHPRGPELAPAANRSNRQRWTMLYRRALRYRRQEQRYAAMRAVIESRAMT